MEKQVAGHHLECVNRELHRVKWLGRIPVTTLLTDRAAGHHVADLVVATWPVHRRPGPQDTFGLPEMTIVNASHHLLT